MALGRILTIRSISSNTAFKLFIFASILTIKKTESVCPHKKNYNPSSGHQPQQTTYKVKKAKEDEPRRSRNII